MIRLLSTESGPPPRVGGEEGVPRDIIWLQIKALLQHGLSKKERSCWLACWPHHCWRSLQTSKYHLEMIWPWDSRTGERLEWPATPNSCPALRNKAGMNGSWRQKIITQPEVTPCEGGDTLWVIHNPIRATGIVISQPSWSPQHGINFKCPFSMQTLQCDFWEYYWTALYLFNQTHSTSSSSAMNCSEHFKKY